MAVSLLAGCGGSGSTESGNGGTTAAAGGEAGGSQEINIGINTDLTSLDPHNHNDTASAYATRHIYSNLVRLTEDNEFVGDLADSWEYIDDVTVEFTLKEGVKFHDGSTLTA